MEKTVIATLTHRDKQLADNDKIASAQMPERPANAARPQGNFTDASIGAYSDLSRKSYDAEEKAHAWKDSLKGRLIIRAGSRGVLGAAFFAAGGLLTDKWMHSKEHYYDPTKKFSEQKNPLQFMAKLIDTVAGKPIQWTVEQVSRPIVGQAQAHDWAMRSIRFRPTRYDGFGHTVINNVKHGYRGRSLGHEAVGITFDFFCASIGDAWGRDIAGFFDPNIKKNWRDEKGNIKVPEALKTIGKSLFRYVTYNGGEDWAVAIPYAYYMKGQRKLINHFVPGFMYDFDRNLNGASYKIDDHQNIVGNYSAAGALDLQGRFTAYNIGTLMYREAYNYIKNKVNHKQARLYGSPENTEKTPPLTTALNMVKWAVRSAIKGTLYMTPAVPFFWITRVMQKKPQGVFIHKDKGMLSYIHPFDGKPHALHANELRNVEAAPEAEKKSLLNRMHRNAMIEDLFHGTYVHQPSNPILEQFTVAPQNTALNPTTLNGFHDYKVGHTLPQQFLDKIGFANAGLTEWMEYPAKFADRVGGKRIKNFLGIESFTKFSNPFINASVSYTPYMASKYEFAKLWDTGKMDMAVERLIDGAFNLNWGEFKAGLAETRNTILQRPLSDLTREAEGNKRTELDQSPADIDIDNKVQFGLRNRLMQPKHRNSDWRQTIVANRKSDKESDEKWAAESNLKPKSYVEQQELRKALEEFNPPTNSIH